LPRRLLKPKWITEKRHRFFVNCEHETAGIAHDTVGASRRIDDQRAGVGLTVLVALRSSQNKNVLVSSLLMQRNFPGLAKANQRCGGPVNPVAVEAMNIDSVLEGLPGNALLVLGEFEDVAQFETLVKRSRVRFGRERWCRAESHDELEAVAFVYGRLSCVGRAAILAPPGAMGALASGCGRHLFSQGFMCALRENRCGRGVPRAGNEHDSDD